MTTTDTRNLPSVSKPWRKYYSKEALEAPMPKCTVYQHLKNVNSDRLDEVAVDYYGNRITCRSLFAEIDRAANSFAAIGVKQGDIVSFLSVAVPECIASIYAINKIGATANTIDPRLDIDSIRRMIIESTSEVFVFIDVAWPKVEKIIGDIKQKKIVVVSASRSLPFIKKTLMRIKVRTKIPYDENLLRWEDFIKAGEGTTAKEAPYVGDATVAITYTGGTTGFPKGVMLTNDSMNAVAHNFKYAGLVVNHGDRFLGIIPVFTSYGMVCGMHMPLCMRVELLPIPRFVPASLGKLVRSMKPNHMISTPAFYEIMMDSKEVRNLDLSFLITMGSGGDTMNDGLEQKLGQFMKDHNIRYPLAQGYGMSEVSAAASFSVNEIFKSASVGIPSVLTTIGIFDPETGEELPIGQHGEVCIAGPTVMKGYFLRPEETDLVLRKHDDGQIWVHSGDIGYMDEDGFVFIKGRVKRMITRFDGHKVFPVNIEGKVSAYESVFNCCVIGVNDRERSQGQYPMILVEFNEGVDKAAECVRIFGDCMRDLEERGKPVAILPIDKIPLTGALKNDYRALEEEYGTFDYTMWNVNAL